MILGLQPRTGVPMQVKSSKPRNTMDKLLLLLFLLTSCSMSAVLEQPLPQTKVDTTYTPRAIQKDANEVEVSSVPIEFDVTVESWE